MLKHVFKGTSLHLWHFYFNGIYKKKWYKKENGTQCGYIYILKVIVSVEIFSDSLVMDVVVVVFLLG